MFRSERAHFLMAFTGALAALPVIVSAVYGAMAYQMSYVPVVTDFHAAVTKRYDIPAVEIEGSMAKRFELAGNIPVCRFTTMTWWGVAPDGLTAEVKWKTLERPSQEPVNRQAGPQRFGPWLLDYRRIPTATKAYATVDHWCLGIWPTRTILGPIALVETAP